MSESSIDPPDLLPKEGSLLKNEVCQRDRQILLARLEKQELYWIEQLEEHEGAETPDPDQLDLDRAMAMSYRTLTPYVAPSLRSFTFRDHDNQNHAMEDEKCRTFSKLPQTAYEDLERYRTLALVFRFASEAADEGKPITCTQKNHVTCESYWKWYEQRPKHDSVVEGELAEKKLRTWRSTLNGMKDYVWLQSGKQKEYPDTERWGTGR